MAFKLLATAAILAWLVDGIDRQSERYLQIRNKNFVEDFFPNLFFYFNFELSYLIEKIRGV